MKGIFQNFDSTIVITGNYSQQLVPHCAKLTADPAWIGRNTLHPAEVLTVTSFDNLFIFYFYAFAFLICDLHHPPFHSYLWNNYSTPGQFHRLFVRGCGSVPHLS